MLNVKMVPIAYATRASVAFTTEVTAAIAEAPQIPVPTPISSRNSGWMPNRRPTNQAPLNATAKVPSMTGREPAPTCSTSLPVAAMNSAPRRGPSQVRRQPDQALRFSKRTIPAAVFDAGTWYVSCTRRIRGPRAPRMMSHMMSSMPSEPASRM